MRLANVTLALAALTVLAVGAGNALAADTDIVITEIMQNPAVLADTDGEWFEIHNVGPDPVDINGWTVRDDGIDSFIITNGGPLVVPAGAYEVLGRNAAAMATQGVTLFYEYTGMSLSNGDDEIILENTSLVEIDRVMYDGGLTWPDPNGASMMWNEASGDNSVGANWSTSTAPFGGGDLGTPGAPNDALTPLPPVLGTHMRRPILPAPGEVVTITVDATDPDGNLAQVLLYYSFNGGSDQQVVMANIGGDTYSGSIPAGNAYDLVDYRIEAWDTDYQSATKTGNYEVHDRYITPIALLHADSLAYLNQFVTVQAQVYIPGDYKADGASVSAYVQDGSDRGLNIFGTDYSTGSDLLNDVSAVVEVTGLVNWYGTTLELISYEVTTLGTGNPPLAPAVQTTGAAASPDNEGTYVQATGLVTLIATTGGTNPAHNVTIDDGSGPLIVRIDDDLVADFTGWAVGDTVTAAGAGATYLGAGELIVGLASDVVDAGQGPDITAPTLLAANLTAPTSVTLTFDEAIDAVSASVVGNYSVYQTASPTNTIAVMAAAVQADPTLVVLTLDGDPTGVPHTVAVCCVADLAGNPVAAGTTVPLDEPAPMPQIVITEIMQNPAVIPDADGEWFEVYNAGAAAVDMNGWTIRDTDTDSHVIDNGGPMLIDPGEYKVFGINATAMAAEGVTLFYQYAGITLANAGDEIILETPAAVMVDSVGWDDGLTFPDPTGASMQWNGQGDNADGAQWSECAKVFGSGDKGTPGAANDFISPVPVPGAASALQANVPNPFNPSTAVGFVLADGGHARLGIYDLRGRLVRVLVDGRLPAGDYTAAYRWDGRDDRGRAVTSGTYFQRLLLDGKVIGTGKMMLVR